LKDGRAEGKNGSLPPSRLPHFRTKNKEEARMKKAAIALLAVCLCATAGFADTKKGEKITGKKEFQEYCAECHADGGNMIKPDKTLSKKDREANGVKTAKDIIAKMRNPGPGMTKFDKKTISDTKAKAIAEYIIKTFK
jgi:cytochrome c6